jgi:hypothetical protein
MCNKLFLSYDTITYLKCQCLQWFYVSVWKLNAYVEPLMLEVCNILYNKKEKKQEKKLRLKLKEH